jgi:hypothetical protein
MARQLGHVKYKGTIGDIRHFKIKGMSGNFAGLKGGASGEQIKNDAAFVRTRENMNEFGGCAQAARSVRVGLNSLMKQMSDSQLTGRLTGIMKKINLEDQSEARGVRAILISAQSKYLKGLLFNRNISFQKQFIQPFTLRDNGTRNGSTLSVGPFNPSEKVIAPAGATHFRLINALSVISDFAYNATTGMYEAVEPTLNEASSINYSDYIDMAVESYMPTNVYAELSNELNLTSNVTVLNSIGIEFYQYVGNKYYLLGSGNALNIENVY